MAERDFDVDFKPGGQCRLASSRRLWSHSPLRASSRGHNGRPRTEMAQVVADFRQARNGTRTQP